LLLEFPGGHLLQGPSLLDVVPGEAHGPGGLAQGQEGPGHRRLLEIFGGLPAGRQEPAGEDGHHQRGVQADSPRRQDGQEARLCARRRGPDHGSRPPSPHRPQRELGPAHGRCLCGVGRRQPALDLSQGHGQVLAQAQVQGCGEGEAALVSRAPRGIQPDLDQGLGGLFLRQRQSLRRLRRFQRRRPQRRGQQHRQGQPAEGGEGSGSPGPRPAVHGFLRWLRPHQVATPV